jgi:hypothetical protein
VEPERASENQGKNAEMKRRIRRFEEQSPLEFLLLRENLGMKRYRKTLARDREKKQILLQLGLKKIEEREKNDFLLLEFRRRKVNIF